MKPGSELSEIMPLIREDWEECLLPAEDVLDLLLPLAGPVVGVENKYVKLCTL